MYIYDVKIVYHMTILEKFGKKVIIQREKLGLTQMDLASLCELSDLTIRNIERGKEGTSIGNWLNVADKLGMKFELTIKNMINEKRESI